VNSRLFRCTEEGMLVLGSMENSAVVLALLLTKVRARPFHKTSPLTHVRNSTSGPYYQPRSVILLLSKGCLERTTYANSMRD
jgi:hypothetical protein